MSAPDTDIEKEKHRHATPIWGIVISVLFGVLVGAAITATAIWRGDDPGSSDQVIDGRTGEVEQVD